MKIVYDISVLGYGHYFNAKAGIFRAVENLAYGLKNAKEDDLFFYVSGDAYNIFTALNYLESNPELVRVPLFHKNWKLRRNLNDTLRFLNSKIDSTSKLQKIPLQALRKIVIDIVRQMEIFSERSDAKSLGEFDIYHSPFYAIPPQVRETSYIKKFLTVNDMIPFLYPEFFEGSQQNIDNVVQAVESLDSESYVLCISQSTKNDLCNYSKNLAPERIFITPLAASQLFYHCSDAQKIEATRRKYNIPNAPYILSLGTLEPRKNVVQTIRCFIKLVEQQNIKDLYLVLAGSKGWSYEKIFAEISSNHNLKDKIIVTGYVADEDLAPLYSGALAFVYPSFYEGFGLPPLEAMQCGVPVITSNTSSLPEVVGDAGIMVAPKDVDGLCHSMFELYSNLSLRQSLADKSLEQAKKFSWEKCTSSTIAAYKTALST
ncbi:MAG: glycosyltransferase family 1 protein [Rhizonema sp. PD37]|nr:glycosyltransferase family 1 protein [Rhizonema sp. PD37]